MIIVGISAYYHDSAVALLRNGKIIAAAQEERFSRTKHDASFPGMALQYCLDEAGIAAEDIDYVVFYDKPFLKFERLLDTYLSFAPRGFASFKKAMPLWIGEKLFMKTLLAKELSRLSALVDWTSKLLFSEHHLSHAASAFYPSPFAEAAVLTLDGVGEWATSSIAVGSGRRLQVLKELHFPHSMGLLYSAFTHHLGFRVNSGEYKVMGLAPYGRPQLPTPNFWARVLRFQARVSRIV
jgi:carbamoyltransferase